MGGGGEAILCSCTHLLHSFAEDVEGRVSHPCLNGLLDPVIDVDCVGGGRAEVLIVDLLHGSRKLGEEGREREREGEGKQLDIVVGSISLHSCPVGHSP